MTERLKVHAWKACVPDKGTEGSNPSLSARSFFKKIALSLSTGDSHVKSQFWMAK